MIPAAGIADAGTAGILPASTAASEDAVVWRSRGYLPHVDAPSLVQHVIFRLADSVPPQVLKCLAALPNRDRVFATAAALDAGYGRRDLAKPAIAALVQSALLKFDGRRYALIAWCIMPSHVHVLATIVPGYPLDRVVHAWKSYTASRANRMLGRAGPFWAAEYFDRFMRDEEHLASTAAYIEGNPVKAGLCEDVSNWPFSSAWRGWSGQDARGPEPAAATAGTLLASACRNPRFG